MSPSLAPSVRRYTAQGRANPCPHGGKNSYRTQRKARRVAEGLHAVDGIRLYVYRCPNCKSWHLTKRTPAEQAEGGRRA